MKKLLLLLFVLLATASYCFVCATDSTANNVSHNQQSEIYQLQQKNLEDKIDSMQKTQSESMAILHNHQSNLLGIVSNLLGIGSIILAFVAILIAAAGFFGYDKLHSFNIELKSLEEQTDAAKQKVERLIIETEKETKRISKNIQARDSDEKDEKEIEIVSRQVDLTRVLKTEDEYTEYDWLLKALEAQNNGYYDQVQQYYEKVLEKNPQNESVINNWAYVLNKLGQHDQAIVKAGQAIAINPKIANSYSHYGFALNQLGRYEEAIAYYKKAVEVNPTYQRTYDNWNEALKMLEAQNKEFYPSERDEFKKILEQNKELPELKNYQKFQDIYTKYFPESKNSENAPPPTS